MATNRTKVVRNTLSATGYQMSGNLPDYLAEIVKQPAATIQHRLATALDIAGLPATASADDKRILSNSLLDLFVAEADSFKAETASKSLLSLISDESDLSAEYEVAYGKAYYADCKSSGSVGSNPQPKEVSLFRLSVGEIKSLAEAIISLRAVKSSIRTENLFLQDLGGKQTSAGKGSLKLG